MLHFIEPFGPPFRVGEANIEEQPVPALPSDCDEVVGLKLSPMYVVERGKVVIMPAGEHEGIFE